MIHLYGEQETGCCSTPILDLPKEDTLTFVVRRVTCGTNALRHPPLLAEWLYQEIRPGDQLWAELPGSGRDHWISLATRLLFALGYAE